eukprot:COSAG06_NODE_36619_length_444_cov_61.991304_1_plen_83_part_10
MQALVQQHVAALDRDGFTTIRRAVDPALVDSMRAAFESYLATVQERELPLRGVARKSGRLGVPSFDCMQIRVADSQSRTPGWV